MNPKNYPTPPLEIMTSKDVGKILGIDSSTLAVWRCKGLGPAYFKLGGPQSQVRYKKEDVIAWIKSRTRITPLENTHVCI